VFPLRDDVESLSAPLVTVAIILLNFAVWMLVQGLGSEPTLSRSVCALGLIPAELLGHLRAGARVSLAPDAPCVLHAGASWFTPFTSMFLHGGWFHIIGNMWFLWVFGDNVEAAMGRVRFVVFYLLCGLAAAALQTATNPASVMPMVGASGAIGGVMGAYLVQHPRARVLTVLVLGIFIRTVWVPAWLMLGYWFLLQFLGGLPALGRDEAGVAFAAHIGGFVAGMALMPVFRRGTPPAPLLWREAGA
jgi:membrane associated rhomboid family serine protease